MRVQVDRHDGLVRSVLLVDDEGTPVESACRFLRYVIDTGGSPNTAVAYGYDLRYLFEFLAESVNLTGASFSHLWRSTCSAGCASVPAGDVYSN